MSSWNCTSPENRLSKWKEFREEIKGDDEEILLNKTAMFFADMPVGARCIDYYTPDTWPTPWEILYHGLFCPNSISLLIYHTLSLLLEEGRVEIILIEDDQDRFLVPLLDKKHILNYVLGEISSIGDFPNIEVIETFRNEEIVTFK